MLPTRRDVLRGSSSAAALAGLECIVGNARSQATAQQGADDASYEFWTRNIRNAEIVGTRSLEAGNAPHATFVFFDPHAGFVAGSDIGDAGLSDRGDIHVQVNVDHIHLSRGDQGRLSKLQGGSLRIDLQQAQPLPSLGERLAWTAVAGLLSNNKELPLPKDMHFDPGMTWGKLQSVPLPGGGGRWTWNFFLQQRKSRWVQLVEMVRKNASLVAPLAGFGLPAIAVTALQTVDAIVGELTREASTDWLFQSPDVFVYATKAARDSFEGSKLRLRQGMYVVVPSTQLAAFSAQASGLEIKDGLIVPKGTRSLDVLDASTKTLADVTYLTVGMTARGSAVKT